MHVQIVFTIYPITVRTVYAILHIIMIKCVFTLRTRLLLVETASEWHSTSAQFCSNR